MSTTEKAVPQMASQTILDGLIEQNKLPIISETLIKLEQALESATVSNQQIVDIVSHDALVVKRLLTTVNSVLYRRGTEEIQAVGMAINRMGVSQTRNIVHAATLHATVKASPRVNMREFWRDAIISAFVAKLLADYVNKNKQVDTHINGDLAFLAGLVRDLGVILLDWYFDKPYKQSLGFTPRPIEDILHNERWHNGITHSVIGGAVLAFWQFPKEVIMGVAGHHHPDKIPARLRHYAHITYLAETASHYLGNRNGLSNPKLYAISDTAEEMLKALHMPLKDYKDLINNAIEISEASNMLQMF